MTKAISIPIIIDKPIKRRNTIKQQKLVNLILDNLGNKGKRVKTMYLMMLEAGYQETTAKEQSVTLTGIRDDLKPIVEQMKTERQAMIQRLKKTIDKAGFRDLVSGVDIMTKNIQLLSGDATENIKYGWDDYGDN